MIDSALPEAASLSPSEPFDGEASRQDVASYVFELSREMSGMADRHGMSKLAAALELARGLAAEELAALAIQSRAAKLAPGEAT
jgi:hypothetical protein